MEHLSKFYKNKKVLITGHTGFKGGWLSQIMLLWGAKVSGVGLRPNTDPNFFSALKIKNKINNHFVDVRHLQKLKAVLAKEKPEIVFHLAAQPIVRDGYDDPIYTFETNIMGTANVLEAIRSTKSVRSAVMITTDKVYENNETGASYKEGDRLGGGDPYSSSKASAELVIDSYAKSFFHSNKHDTKRSIMIASVRAGNVIGGGDWSKDRIMTDLVRSVFEKKRSLVIRNPESIRPWQYVLDPLYGYITLAKNLYDGNKNSVGAWNFGPKEDGHIKVKDLLSLAFKYLEMGSYVVKGDSSKPEAVLLRLDSSKAQNELNWNSSISGPDAIKLTLDWYKNYYTGGGVVSFTSKQINEYFKKHENKM